MKTNTASGSGFSIYQAFPAPESQLDLFQYWTIHTYTALQRTKKTSKEAAISLPEFLQEEQI